MYAYRCQKCKTIWNDNYAPSRCPNCYDTSASPITSEKSVRLRLLQSNENWSLECRGEFGESNSFEKISWKNKPSQQTLHETLNDYLKKLLEE